MAFVAIPIGAYAHHSRPDHTITNNTNGYFDHLEQIEKALSILHDFSDDLGEGYMVTAYHDLALDSITVCIRKDNRMIKGMISYEMIINVVDIERMLDRFFKNLVDGLNWRNGDAE